MHILIVEDYPHTRKTICYGLKTQMNKVSLTEADNGLSAINCVKADKRIEVVLMDISMPIMNGIDATKKIKEINNDIKVIMLTSMQEKEHVLSSFNSGANAYCLKNIKMNELINVINSVINGAIWIDPSIANFIMEIFQSTKLSFSQKENAAEDFDLTAREKEILKYVSLGKTNKDIAEELFLSIHTVKNHLKNILQKLCVDDRTQAAILAIQEKLV